MLPAYLDIRDVDKRLRSAVVGLNRLPYVATIASCEGHVFSGGGGVPWQLPEAWLDFQTDGSRKTRRFVNGLRELCAEYGFVDLQLSYKAETESEINSRIHDSRLKIYGFKFPLGKHAYSIVTERFVGSKRDIIRAKRALNMFWWDLATLAGGFNYTSSSQIDNAKMVSSDAYKRKVKTFLNITN